MASVVSAPVASGTLAHGLPAGVRAPELDGPATRTVSASA